MDVVGALITSRNNNNLSRTNGDIDRLFVEHSPIVGTGVSSQAQIYNCRLDECIRLGKCPCDAVDDTAAGEAAFAALPLDSNSAIPDFITKLPDLRYFLSGRTPEK